METIEIAPKFDTVQIDSKHIWVEWHGLKITYTLPARKAFTEDLYSTYKRAFVEGIALASKWWQLEDCLNRYFNVKGRLITEDLATSANK